VATIFKTGFESLKTIGLALFLGMAVMSAAWADNGNDSQPLFLKAMEDLKAEHWTQAQAELKKVLEVDPENLKAHFYLGETEYYTGHFSEAEAYFHWVDVHDPDLPVNHYYLGRLAYDQKRYEMALSEIQASIRLDDQTAIVHYYLGLIYYKESNLPGAQSELELAVNLDPSSSKAHYALAYLLYHDLHEKYPALVQAEAAKLGDSDSAMKDKALKLQNQIKNEN
jgi:tetratricopeptide (TPR) repeat protein